MKKALLLLFVSIITIACGNSETSKAEKNQTENVATEKEAAPAITEKATTPCGFVTEAKIKEVLGIPADATTKMEDVVLSFPTCFYEWESITVIKKQSIGGQELSLEYPAKASIVVVKNASEEMFGMSTTGYKDGEAQNGIGDMAIWGSQMSQLSFLAKGKMIHLHVKVSTDNEVNKAKATELAALIIKKL